MPHCRKVEPISASVLYERGDNNVAPVDFGASTAETRVKHAEILSKIQEHLNAVESSADTPTAFEDGKPSSASRSAEYMRAWLPRMKRIASVRSSTS